MALTRFEKILPWSGVVAALCWIGQDPLQHVSHRDIPGGASAAVINDHLGLNHAAAGCLVVMGVSLVFFATAVRNLLRSSEAGEATYSQIAYGGWLVVVAGLSQMVVLSWGLYQGAADAHDNAAVRTLGYLQYFGWSGMGIGLAVAFVATGLGGLSGGVLPKWFASVSIVLGVLGALGDAGVPPGGLVNYLLLPVWLIVGAILIARRQQRMSAPSPETMTASAV